MRRLPPPVALVALAGLLLGVAGCGGNAAPTAAAAEVARDEPAGVAATGVGPVPTTSFPAPVAPAVGGTVVANATAWGANLPAGAVAVPAERLTPRRLRVAALDIDAPVVTAGVGADGALALPADVVSVAWFESGAAPGDSGSAVLAAHVDHAGQEGLFFGLADLPSGSPIEVELSDGSVRTFASTGPAVDHPKSSLPAEELFRRGGPPTLALVTCGGAFDAARRSYEDNVVVTAAPLPAS